MKLPARRQREDITDTCEAIIMNIKKSRVDGQDSQLDNDNEQSSANIQDSRLANYSKQSPSASAFSDHVNLEDETNCTTDNNSIKKHHPSCQTIQRLKTITKKSVFIS